MEAEITFESNLGFCREFLAAPIDAKACGRVSRSGATSFAAFGDSVSERGASEPVAECPTGMRQNFCSMWEMVFQSEELQSMWQNCENTNNFEAVEGRRRAGITGGRRAPDGMH